MRFLLFLLFLLSGITETMAQDLSLYEKKWFISSRGDRLPYRILYPIDYNPAKAYPLIVVLHGGGERGNDNEKQLTHGANLFLADSNRKQYPAIVLFPQCSANSYWARADIRRDQSPYAIRFNYQSEPGAPLQALLELVREMRDKKQVLKNKIFITGLSMGGMGTFEAVYRAPGLFAAAAPICGGGDPASYTRAMAKIPFRVFHGTDDPVVGVELSRSMVARLKELGGRVEYIEYPGVQHNSWDKAFAEPDFIGWFFRQKQ
jgi:predicted peptidase